MGQLSLHIISSVLLLEEGCLSSGHNVIDNALSFADINGIHVFDFLFLAFGVYRGLLAGDLNTAWHYLERVESVIKPQAAWDTAQFQFLIGAFAIYAEDSSRACKYLDSSKKLAEYCGTPIPVALTGCVKAHFHLEKGDLSHAIEELDHVKAMGIVQHSYLIHFLYELVRADCSRVQLHAEKMLAHLQSAFTGAAENGLGLPIGLIRSRLAVLCAEALRANIHTDIVTEFIQRLQLTSPPAGQAGEKWPWPVRVYTLGRLEIICQGKAIDLGIKPPKKPLELLKLLIYWQDDGIIRETVADNLWPDSDGDRAIQNINTTLYRLRKLLGNEQAILLKNGRLSLNPALCWVDAWYFKALTEETKTLSDRQSRINMLARALDAYGGFFDSLQDNNPWAIEYSKRLLTAWVDAVVTLGCLLNEEGRNEESETLLQKALTQDDTAEPVYQTLMHVLAAQGKIAKALLTFNRCRNALAKHGIEPAKATLVLYHKLKTAHAGFFHSTG